MRLLCWLLRRLLPCYRRTTSQGVPEAKLGYTPGVTPKYLAIPLSETVMTRYPDYRMAYWKDYTYVQGYMFEAMDRLGQLTGDSGIWNI